MKFYTKKRRQPVPVILPLIDILAILLIFFIVTTTFKRPNLALQINLPESANAVEAPAESAEPLLLQVRGEREIFLDNEPVDVEELPVRLREKLAVPIERKLALQADREAPFGLIVRILDALQEAGIKNIPAFTQPRTPQTNQPSPTQ